MQAYGSALGRCSTEAGPWYVVPANRKWYPKLGRLAASHRDDGGNEVIYPNPHLDVRALKKSLQAAA
jgi:hypothetical protein